MMKRRLLSLLLALVITLALVPFGSIASAGEVTEIMFWGHVDSAWNAAFDAIIEKFNASQSEIVVSSAYFPYDDFEAKTQTSLLSGGEGADIYECWGGWAIDFGKNGALAPVPAELMAGIVADSYEPALGAFKGADDTYYGIPLEYNIEYGAMIVNKPRFEAAGIAYPTTWDEMIQIARDTAVSDGEFFEMRGLDFPVIDTLTAGWLSMVLSTGGEYFVDGKLDFDTPEGIATMQTLVDYVAVDHITNTDSITGAAGPDITAWHFIGLDEAMQVWRGPWVIPNLMADYGKEYGVDFDYISQPFYGDIKAFPAETGWGVVVGAQSAKAEAAWKFAEFMFQPENILELNIACGMIPSIKTAAHSPEFIEAVPYAQPIIDVLEYGRWLGPFNSDVLKEAVGEVFVSLATNDGTYASTEEALATLEANMNAAFGF